jgi:hypothetical protein
MENRRKKWEARSDITPELIKFREKRKWQIALRRYVVEKNPSAFYAPYFGLDIQNLRNWFAIQFEPDMNWDNFGKKWQLDHIIPVTCFDFSVEAELKICWNFINLRVTSPDNTKNRSFALEILSAKAYFEELYKATLYLPCLRLLEKIRAVEFSGSRSAEKQKSFLLQNKSYIDLIENYSSFEFGLLNDGRDPDSIKKEMAFFKKQEN